MNRENIVAKQSKPTIEALLALITLAKSRNWTQDEELRDCVMNSVMGVAPDIVNAHTDLKSAIVDLLRILLQSHDWQQAEQAAEKLGALQALEAVDDLIAVASGNRDTKVRLTAIEALGRMGTFSGAIKQTLHTLAQHQNPSISGTALDALEEIEAMEISRGIDQNAFGLDLATRPDAALLLRIYETGAFASDTARITFLESSLRCLVGTSPWSPESFPWPSTHVHSVYEDHGDLTVAFEPVGMLSKSGYRVGRNGLPVSERRKSLTTLFLAPTLPQLNSRGYVMSWGGSNSAVRLQKMADSMAAFCRHAKRRAHADMTNAVFAWEDDLHWLKKKYYDGRFDFPWPRIK